MKNCSDKLVHEIKSYSGFHACGYGWEGQPRRLSDNLTLAESQFVYKVVIKQLLKYRGQTFMFAPRPWANTRFAPTGKIFI